jgi:hypothetical protein
MIHLKPRNSLVKLLARLVPALNTLIIYNHKLGKLRLKITRFAQRYMLMILADIRPRKMEAAIDL